ncbi:hypothetical protein ACOYW6_12245 [Parablastomonas sp. CN1-191]|uniref:hypothetical protein n=1 Tax=Parablastomonas sp. CN1-191 TaxID=3400908 RepID=UPI003BF85AEE
MNAPPRSIDARRENHAKWLKNGGFQPFQDRGARGQFTNQNLVPEKKPRLFRALTAFEIKLQKGR